jgi:CheY-like chemotaxis protein
MQPDLVVLDLMMPRLGGIDALAHIRRWFPDVAVIVLTGHAR